MVLLCALVGAAFAYHHASSKPQKYVASAQLLFGTNVNVFAQLGIPSALSNGSTSVQATNAGLAGLPIISTMTHRALGSHLPPGGVSVTTQALGATNLVEVLAESLTPSGAVQVANAYVQQFVLYQQQQQQQQDRQAIAQVKSAIAARRAQGLAPGNLLVALGNLESIAAANPVSVSVVQPATSASPVGQKTKTKAVEGLLLGGIVGMIIALLLDWFDPRLRDVTDEEFYGLRAITLKDLPKQAGYVATTAITRRLLSEAARQSDVTPQLIAITSTGKQHDVQSAKQLAAALAQTAAANGLSAGIVRVAHPSEGSSAPGGDSPDGEFLGDLSRTKLMEGVDAIDVAPQALLHGAAARDLEAELRDSYRIIVVVDERPSAFSALAQLVKSADVSVLVATLGRTNRRDAAAAAEALVQMGPTNAVFVAFPAGFRAALQKALALQPAS